ncbi:hypothetical protein D3C86_1667120 [compost metagenome]
MFLGHLRPEVAAVEHPFGPDHAQRNMVFDAVDFLRRQQVVPGRFKKVQRRMVFERRRVGYVDHHVGIVQRIEQSCTTDDVDAGTGGRRQGFVPQRLQVVAQLAADQASAADDDDFHGRSSVVVSFN